MDFELSREEWKNELRSKSPMYAMFDENHNVVYEEVKKVDKNENDTDNDSGLPSIDGDTPREKNLKHYLMLEDELVLSRQDSGLSSESSEIAPPSLSRFGKERQLGNEALTTNNRRSLGLESRQQVDVNALLNTGPASNLNHNEELKDATLRRKDITKSHKNPKRDRSISDPKGSDTKRDRSNSGTKDTENGKSAWTKTNFSQKLGNVFGRKKLDDSHKHSYNNTTGGSYSEGEIAGKNLQIAKDSQGDKQKRQNITELKNKPDTQDRSDRARSKTHPRESTSDRCDRDRPYLNGTRAKGTPPDAIQKSQNLVLWDEMWTAYKDLTMKLTDTVDQLLYKDLMCAHLTAEILNFSNDNFTVEEDLLDVEAKYLEDEIFNTTSLLQTLEVISVHQEIESQITVNEIKKTDSELREYRMKLQILERQFRNSKFRYAPKQLKRYCSVESLMSDICETENEKKVHFDEVWNESDEYDEEVSLV
eukprot:Seg1289.3 transcript_id=Seg1289.3/GoldUCD/mRNA.D3Y31 product="hypothetical protein" protein_id=Seg1289.3/GoldUCD/D3Y31